MISAQQKHIDTLQSRCSRLWKTVKPELSVITISFIIKTSPRHQLFIRLRKRYSQQPAYPRGFQTLTVSSEIVTNYSANFRAGEPEKLSVSWSNLLSKASLSSIPRYLQRSKIESNSRKGRWTRPRTPRSNWRVRSPRLFVASENMLILVSRSLRHLNLPSSLEALEKPIGLPPSLLRKAEEVRQEDGPEKIQASLEDVSRLAHQDQTILDDVWIKKPSLHSLPNMYALLIRHWTYWMRKPQRMKPQGTKSLSAVWSRMKQMWNSFKRRKDTEIFYLKQLKATNLYDRSGMNGRSVYRS